MNKAVTLIHKEVYGRVLIYPNCEVSKELCRLLNCKTLKPEWVEFLKHLGFLVVVRDHREVE